MEIVPGIHQVDGVKANCYIIVGDSLTLIDTGFPHSTKKIVKYIEEILKRKPSDINTIVLTHAHIDHIGNVGELKKISNANVAIHEAEADYLTGRKPQPARKSFLGIILKIMSLFFKAPHLEPDIRLKDGDIIDGLTCIYTPGHTPGSICLFSSSSKVMFAGDLLRFDGRKIEGAPRQFTMDTAESERSIKKIAARDFDVILPGHGIPLRPDASVKIREYADSLP
ncbi:MAG: MBL fold metallo-hydrolase [Methanoregula sp.]|jgi:glyoxylase-like metal-dependent hydrolase (beta-lactamase superfamily II)